MKKIGGRTVTVTCLGTMSNEETMDILATYIANKIYEQRHQNNSKLIERK